MVASCSVDVIAKDFDSRISSVGLSVSDSVLMERYPLVGSNPEKTNSFCGNFSGYYICDRVDLHELIGRKIGKDYANKAFVRKVHFNCGKPLCPACYRSSWAGRQAHRMEVRLDATSKMLKESSPESSEVLHAVVSISPKDYGIADEKVLRAKAKKALDELDFVGGGMVFHGSRHRRYELLKCGAKRQIATDWSPHYHGLFFLKGGYSRCRNCVRKSNCLFGCGGWDDRRWQYYLKTGIYVKIMPKREKSYYDDKPNVGSTAWYFLNHSSVRRGAKRAVVVNWMGVSGYRKMKVVVEKRKQICPICGYELKRSLYSGHKHHVTSRYAFDYERDTLEDYTEDGVVVWSDAPRNWFMRDSVGDEPRYGSMEWLKRARRRSVVSWSDSYGEGV